VITGSVQQHKLLPKAFVKRTATLCTAYHTCSTNINSIAFSFTCWQTSTQHIQSLANSNPACQRSSFMEWAAISKAWLGNPWLLWGVGPYLATNAGFILTAVVLEVLLTSGLLDQCLIVYASSSNTPRKQLMAETHKRIPFRCGVAATNRQPFQRPRVCTHLHAAWWWHPTLLPGPCGNSQLAGLNSSFLCSSDNVYNGQLARVLLLTLQEAGQRQSEVDVGAAHHLQHLWPGGQHAAPAHDSNQLATRQYPDCVAAAAGPGSCGRLWTLLG